jgi:GxxExxY protein
MKYEDITAKIIGCAMKVHSTMGNGFQEVIYQRCLEIELNKADLMFAREYEMPIMYDGIEVGTRRVDFLVEGKISVELKALIALEDVHLAQAMNYLARSIYQYTLSRKKSGKAQGFGIRLKNSSDSSFSCRYNNYNKLMSMKLNFMNFSG